ncbi:DUF202 domain-containing protein [Mycolicibacterium sp.]|uniref:DUF202 domain-containing protein n=1 Tax=Mycolicibacterium sp. TaxID=2320850 RepID=UPI0025D7C415|nr:DUF202 domain-containing protein [Mycolicibacterium sp.]
MNGELLDVGAQAERTALAWQRTGIGAIAVGILLMRGHAHDHLFSLWPGLLLAVGAGLAISILVPQRYRRMLRTVQSGRTPLSRGMVPGATLVLVVATVAIGVELLRG